MVPDNELFDVSKIATFDDNRGREPFRSFDDRLTNEEFNNTLFDRFPTIKLPSKSSSPTLDTKFQNLLLAIDD